MWTTTFGGLNNSYIRNIKISTLCFKPKQDSLLISHSTNRYHMVAHIPIWDTNEQEKQINTVEVTSSLSFSFDSALQALCKARISCTHSQTRRYCSQ